MQADTQDSVGNDRILVRLDVADLKFAETEHLVEAQRFQDVGRMQRELQVFAQAAHVTSLLPASPVSASRQALSERRRGRRAH